MAARSPPCGNDARALSARLCRPKMVHAVVWSLDSRRYGPLSAITPGWGGHGPATHTDNRRNRIGRNGNGPVRRTFAFETLRRSFAFETLRRSLHQPCLAAGPTAPRRLPAR